MSLLHKLRMFFRTNLKRYVKAPKARLKRRKWEQRLRGTPEERFTRIYTDRAWSSKESISGTGSEYRYTENLRTHLPVVFETYSIARLLDAPCGDFNWMKYVVHHTNIDYIGGDIVRDLIEDNRARYPFERTHFVHLDITKDPLPDSDMMMVRDCLFHLSYADICALMTNFCDSGIPYLFTTTHKPAGFENRDILTGDFRFIDLFAAPFDFPSAPLFRVDDFIEGHAPREMCLFTREQVAFALLKFKAAIGDLHSPLTP